jgi:predicted pyridoxine 5'-phosphate oxidase superfamily flavin-nucleotide-binding protein
MQTTHFNADELAAQRLAGGGPRGDGIRDFMHEQYRDFFSQLPYLFVGGIDAAGWPLAAMLTGQPGFVQSPNAVTLQISALPDPDDPAAQALVPGRSIGLLGIDLATRWRVRANGNVVNRDAAGIRVAVAQSFGNCPQYIQRRTILPQLRAASGTQPMAADIFDRLDEAARAAIGAADTFFVASRSRALEGAGYGADISHRGGRPGFIRIDDERGGGNVLTIPDFRGNRYFNTLSNLMVEPRASLLFVDFENGDLLQLQGTAQVDWDGAAAQRFPGAERLWRFNVARGWRRRAASALRWSFLDYAPTTLQTGAWS